jgi:hypothetical protein
MPDDDGLDAWTEEFLAGDDDPAAEVLARSLAARRWRPTGQAEVDHVARAPGAELRARYLPGSGRLHLEVDFGGTGTVLAIGVGGVTGAVADIVGTASATLRPDNLADLVDRLLAVTDVTVPGGSRPLASGAEAVAAVVPFGGDD